MKKRIEIEGNDEGEINVARDGDTKPTNVEKFIAAYIEAIYFTDTGDNGQPASSIHLSAGARQEVKRDCLLFLKEAEPMIPADDDYSQAGHDFWLTRNGHGAGFWDGDWPEHGKALTEIAEGFGACETYQDGNGELEVM